jgi:nitrogen regulatory protein PII 2
MKHIMAIIRNVKMNETKQALANAGLPSFTALGVMGRGRGRGLGPSFQQIISDNTTKEMLAQLGPEPRLKSKRLIILVVTDDKKDLAVQTIIKTNQTGNSGDGKILVIETLGSVRIRTGETGDTTLD